MADGVLARIPAKRRRDAVIAIEQVLSASPEFFQLLPDGKWHPDQVKVWARKSLAWLQREHGDNLISLTLHLDESSPHLHALVAPMTVDGRLCAKEYTARQRLIDWQTSYAKEMGSMGLVRGVEGSQATHTSLKAFRRLIDAPTPPRPPAPAKPNIGAVEGMMSAGKAKKAAYEEEVQAYNSALNARSKAIYAKAKMADLVVNSDTRARRAAAAEAREKQAKREAEGQIREAKLAASNAQAEAEKSRIAIQTLEKATLVSCAKLINGMPRDQLAKALDVELGKGDVIDQLRRRGLVNDLRGGVAFIAERIGGENLVELATWSDDLVRAEPQHLSM